LLLAVKMRVLVIADSHGKKLQAIFERLEPAWTVLIVTLGRRTNLLSDLYDSRRMELIRFRPDAIILHSGHNDIVAHARHNREPIGVRELFPKVMSFRRKLVDNHPLATVFLSSLYPRTQGADFSLEQVGIYNRMAKRHMESVRSASKSGGFRRLLNRVLWVSVKQCKEEIKYFDRGGLHLNAEGREAICVAWIAQLKGEAD
jgi:lysophospholipase L1-like esterase